MLKQALDLHASRGDHHDQRRYVVAVSLSMSNTLHSLPSSVLAALQMV